MFEENELFREAKLREISQQPCHCLAEILYDGRRLFVLPQLVPKWLMVLPKSGNSDLFMARIKGDEDTGYSQI